MTLDDIIPNKAQLARDMGVTSHSVYRWVKNGAIPPKHLIRVANALDVELPVLLPFAQRTYERTRIKPKGLSDLDVLEAAYEGRPYTLPEHMTERSLRITLGHWKERLPLMVTTLREVAAATLTRNQAAQQLGVSPTTMKGLALRYAASHPQAKPKPKPKGRVSRNRDLAPSAVSDVISGRTSVTRAAEAHEMNLRTLHRHIAAVLRPQTVNEISAWSRAFRATLAWEIEHNHTRLSVEWREMAEKERLLLPKRPKFPKFPQNLRETSVKQLILHWLLDEISVDELTRLRGGSDEVWAKLFSTELHNAGLFSLPSRHHKAAAAEYLLARQSHFRAAAPQPENTP